MADMVQWMTGVRAVVFDVDGTLYDQGPLRRAMVTRLLQAHLLHPVEGYRTTRILAAYRRAQEQLRSSRELGDVAALQLQLASWICDVDQREVERVVQRWMEDEAIRVLPAHRKPEVADALRTLSSRGVRLGVLSDYPPERKLEALGLSEHFDAVVYAQQPDVGSLKPHPRGLVRALELLGVAPSEAVYVGDRPEVDGAVAAKVGVRCVIVGGSHAAPEPVLAISSFEELPLRLAAA